MLSLLIYLKGLKWQIQLKAQLKEPESGKKGFNIHEKVGKLGNDIDVLAKKTGDEASKLAKNIIRKLIHCLKKSSQLMSRVR